MLDAVRFAGGWLYDRVMAGWDVTVLIDSDEDLRPLEILGAETRDLESALASWADRPAPADRRGGRRSVRRDARVRQGVLNALEQGATEVTLWGERLPAELDSSVDSVQHQLSAAARAFKAQALAAAATRRHRDVGDRRDLPLRHDGPSVAADLIPGQLRRSMQARSISDLAHRTTVGDVTQRRQRFRASGYTAPTCGATRP